MDGDTALSLWHTQLLPAGRASIEPVGFPLTQPGFGPAEKSSEFLLCTEKRKVLLPPIFCIAGKYTKYAEEQGCHRQRIQYGPPDKYEYDIKNQGKNSQEAVEVILTVAPIHKTFQPFFHCTVPFI